MSLGLEETDGRGEEFEEMGLRYEREEEEEEEANIEVLRGLELVVRDER